MRNKKSRIGTILNPCCQWPANCHAKGQHWSAAPISRSFGIGSLSL